MYNPNYRLMAKLTALHVLDDNFSSSNTGFPIKGYNFKLDLTKPKAFLIPDDVKDWLGQHRKVRSYGERINN